MNLTKTHEFTNEMNHSVYFDDCVICLLGFYTSPENFKHIES